jgi:predicted GNAT family acetyltransferase
VLNVKNVTNLTFQPTKKHLSDIEKWLEKEWNETHEGFYCNWNIIENSFEKGNLNIITENGSAVGFLVYKVYELTAVIDILEIKKSCRKNGLAKMLVNGTLEFLKSNGILAIELFCSPKNSEPFWKKIGFKNFPILPRESRIRLYKTLAETSPLSESGKANSKIELWNCEPYQAGKREPKWIWSLDDVSVNETLDKPLIFPVAQDWQIQLLLNGEVMITDKVKYCGMDDGDYGSFMIIRNIRAEKH